MSRRILALFFGVLALLSRGHGLAAAPPPAQAVPLPDRVMLASRIYHEIATFFPDFSPKQFDKDYSQYLAAILGGSDDRRAFDLASMALVATLHDGHTWFFDDWLGQNYGQAMGLTVYSWEGNWVVVHSDRASIRAGDVVEAIDGIPTQKYFEASRKYISASSDRDAGVSFFDTPVVFPLRFTLTLDGGRPVVVDREHEPAKETPARTEGRWLVAGAVGYVRVRSFRGIETQAAALDYFKQFHDAQAIILDVRGNPGLGEPVPLQRSLMDKPYPLWTEHSTLRGGYLLREYDIAYPEAASVTMSAATIRPRDPVYGGRLILLIDRGCTCACEDFVMPFKVTGRAQLVGENTAGTFSFTKFTQFENGMVLNVASLRRTFPDGSRFEGVGIAPDVEIHPTVGDLKSGRDVVLDRAVALAAAK
jgi:carboxyl-terminal processing protease